MAAIILRTEAVGAIRHEADLSRMVARYGRQAALVASMSALLRRALCKPLPARAGLRDFRFPLHREEREVGLRLLEHARERRPRDQTTEIR
jgi:hypothetical protein